MRSASKSGAAVLALCSLWLVPARADPEEPPPPEVVEEREFHPPEATAADYVAAPFYIPKSLIYALSYPIKLGTGTVFKYDLHKRAVDLLSDETKRIWLIPSASYSTNVGVNMSATFLFNNMLYQQKNLKVHGSLQFNLDRSVSASFEQEPTAYQAFFYRFSFKHKLNTDAFYYGIGIDSQQRDKSVYEHEYYYFTAVMGYQFPRLKELSVLGTVGFEYTDTDTGSHHDNPTVEAVFSEDELIGFDESIEWIRYGLALTYDSLYPKGHAHQGWQFYLSADRYEDLNLSFSHSIFSSGISTVINLYREVNVLALGVHIESTEDRNRGEVPFFRLPALDERSPLRGFPRGRFRDNRNIVGNVEYRFYLWRSLNPDPMFGLGTQIFFDLGKPFNDIESLASGGVLYSVGTGLVLTTRARFIGRAQLAYGGEGIETIFTISRAF